MDPLPEIPETGALNSTDSVIRDTFKERLENESVSFNIAENLKTYSIDDNLSLKETAKNVLGVYKALEEESDTIKNAELDIIQQHGEYIYQKFVIEKNQLLREVMKMKPCDIFPNISLSDKSKYGLIEKCDLYPDMFRQFLDFRFNPTLHKCEQCLQRQNQEHKPVELPPTKTRKKIKESSECALIITKSSFKVQPLEIQFENFELNCCYKKTIKIMNISSLTQILTIKTYPKLSELILEYDSCQIMAPGMNAKGVIKFKPKVLLNLHDQITLISRKGEVITIPIKCSRESPRLVCYVYKSNGMSFIEPERIPGSNGFSFKRQRAVNNTVDCGSCFATEHVLVSLIVTNVGNRGKFFWLTEDDFLNRDVNHLSTNLELCMDGFWVYPSYFEIKPQETSEITILFQPIKCGLQTQTLFLMCDNNTYQQVELVGDAVCFNKHMITIEIPNQTKKLETKQEHCIFMGYLNRKTQTHFTLSISNLSSIYLKFEVKFDSKDEEHSMSNWIQIINMPLRGLAPCTTTDLIFQVEGPDDGSEGYYNTNLKFFVKDIPIASLEEDEYFTIKTNGRKLVDITTALSYLDVLIMDVEVACYLNPLLSPKQISKEPVKICERCTEQDCTCTKCPENSVIDFSSRILDFGLLPVGIEVEKEFLIFNLSSEDLEWYMIELKYSIDHPPHLEVVRENNLTTNSGSLASNQQQSIKYRIVNKTPNRNVSVLVVFSAPKTKKTLNEPNIDVLAQSICLVTYEVIELDIVIQTGQSREPILCPMQMLYSGVPVTVSFKIHNYSLISGCFWLLPPRGTDADKIHVRYNPQSGELNPCQSMSVQLELTCYEVGILDEIFIPCFIGEYQEPLQLRLLCVVDCLHVFFYLPTKNNDFQKVLWPPKVIYEYDSSWSHYCSCEEDWGELEDNLQRKKSDHASKLNRLSEHTLNNIKSEHQELDGGNSGSVLKTLLDQDSDIFLQECVMEVRGITAREPRKITIYLENVTPKSAKYSIQSTNFQAKENHIQACLGPVYKKSEELWGSMITEYGIMIQPERETGYIKPNELVSVDIWVYANTWGIYVEEIVIDLENIVPFSFSMIVEIVGCPLEIPHAIGCITKYPIIRFGTTTFDSTPVERSFHIKNVSSIEVTVSWHVFFLDENYSESSGFNFICDVAENASEVFQFNFTDQFYGNEKFDYIEMLQPKTKVQPNQQTAIPVLFKPSNVKSDQQSIDLRGYIVGQIMVNDSDRLKSNYFHRGPNSLTLEFAASLVRPELSVEVETPHLQIYANEVALKRQMNFFIKCWIRNPTKSVIEATIELLPPLSLVESASRIELNPGQCTQINISCNLSYENILRWGALVYKPPDSLFSVMKCTEKYSISEDTKFDYRSKAITIYRRLNLFYNGGAKRVNPLTIQIFYPHISVKPSNLKFGYVYVDRTKKTTISIFNLTGFTVMFDVYKTVSNQEIFVTPAHGEIEKSVGINRSFTTLAVYFTPTECRPYQESIRIVTNIPSYYVDIPLKGAGSLNEKFT